MALNIYCTDCGSPTSYAGVRPKFCCSCGEPFEKAVAKTQPAAPRAAAPSTPVARPTARRSNPWSQPQTDDGESLADIDLDKMTIHVDAPANEKMTVQSLRANGGSMGGRPAASAEERALKQDILNKMIQEKS